MYLSIYLSIYLLPYIKLHSILRSHLISSQLLSYPRIEKAKIMIANTPMDTDKIKIYGSRVRTYSRCDVLSYLFSLWPSLGQSLRKLRGLLSPMHFYLLYFISIFPLQFSFQCFLITFLFESPFFPSHLVFHAFLLPSYFNLLFSSRDSFPFCRSVWTA